MTYCPSCGKRSPKRGRVLPFHTLCAAIYALGSWESGEEHTYCHECGEEWHYGECE